MEEGFSRYCGGCGDFVFPVEQVLSSGPYFSKQTCPHCGKFLAFGKKPENDGKRGKNKYKPDDLNIDRCQMCLRPKDRLGTRGVLEVHHVTEIQDGGEDIPSNIWILCTSCHKLIHHQRTYLNHHLTNMYTLKDLQGDMEKYHVPADTQAIMQRIFKKSEALANE